MPMQHVETAACAAGAVEAQRRFGPLHEVAMDMAGVHALLRDAGLDHVFPVLLAL